MIKAKKSLSLWLVASVLAALALLLADRHDGEAARKPDAKSGKVTAVPAPAFSSANTGNCAGCHQAYVDSMNDPKMLVSRHREAAGDCFTCHEKGDLEKKHDGVTSAPGKVFRQRRYPNELCLNCHDGYEKLAEKTKDRNVFKTIDGKVINPHDVPATIGGTHAGRTECFNCHKMHKDRAPIEYCFGCHHARQLNNCKDCHSKKG
jgi:hypothetical protein